MPSIPETASEITARDLPTLFEEVLDHLYGRDDPAVPETYLVGFAVTAADPREALAAALREVAALAEEEGAGIAGCSVSGVMATEEGKRAWGYVSLDPARHRATPVAAVRSVERGPDGWRAVLAIATGEER